MKVHELLADPKHWTQGVYARDKDGLSVQLRDPSAVCWCLEAAARKVYGNNYRAVKYRILDHVGLLPIHWNDDPQRTHAEVLALCKELDV